MLNKNQIVEILIEDIGINGEGIGKADGFPLFVKDTVVGDRARVLVLKTKKTYGYGKLLEVLEKGPGRVEAKCPVADKCGGCQLQSYSYEVQLELKADKVRNNLMRIGGFDPVLLEKITEPIIGMENPLYYRNKAQYPVGLDNNGDIVTGFYAVHSHRIVPSENCSLNVKGCEDILSAVKDYMKTQHISAYDELRGKGLIRHILIRKGYATGQWMVCLVINSKKSSSLVNVNKLVERLSGISGMTSISCCFNTRNDNVIMGNVCETLWGSPTIRDILGEVEFEISPLSFYQVNPVQTEKLYKKALEYALGGENKVGAIGDSAGTEKTRNVFNAEKSGEESEYVFGAEKSGEESKYVSGAEKPGKVIWDLYCGIGTISLFLAKGAPRAMVYGVEIIPQAIDDAISNAARNGINNAKFYVGEAEKVLPEHYERTGQGADVIVIDPPRKGCDLRVIETMLKMEPERIVYVSCDSATLARDLKLLSEGIDVDGRRISYQLDRVCPCDMFPMTAHVETVVLMSRK